MTSTPSPPVQGEIDVTIVIPCLNEERAIVATVEEAWRGLTVAGLDGEVMVVDNGSEDASAALAREAGATVIEERRRGYGSAYLAGLAAARGRYIVMADADGTYDLSAIGIFVERLRHGADLVIGSRFTGRMEPGAMPWPNRYIGNPVLTGMLNLLFGSGVSDAHCGLRALRRDVLPQLDMRATGMEFASEMVIKAGKQRLTIEELPIDYRRRIGDSKLSRFSDAWRHVRFMLVHSPTFLFLVPGGGAAAVGFAAMIALAALNRLGDAWTGVSVAAAILTILGCGVVQLGVFSRTYAVIYLGEHDAWLESSWRRFRLEDALAIAGIALFVGFAATTISFFDGVKDPRLGILGLAVMAVAVQMIFASFFLSVLGLSEHAVVRRGS